MGVYTNKNGVVTRVATNNILRNMNTEQYVTEGELIEAMAKKQDVMQFETLPTASADELGKIYQYVGETTTVAPIYTQGYFYKCVSDDGDPATYSWELAPMSYTTPQMFGAKADGITDDTEAITKAYRSIQKDGGVLYFPHGKYHMKLGTILTLNKNTNVKFLGEGKDESQIIFDAQYESINTNYCGIRIWSQGSTEDSDICPKLEIKSLGFVYHNDDYEITYPSGSGTLLLIQRKLKRLMIDDCYFHIGGSATQLPNDNLLWFEGGAEEFTVSNSIFENFSNQRKGGCIWLCPSDNYDSGVLYTIKRVQILNNIVKNTNIDESIAIWPHGVWDNEFNVRDVLIDGNVIEHRNFNGECYRCDNVISFSASTGQGIVNANYFITNNKIVVDKLNYTIINIRNINKATFANNDITVNDVVTTSNKNTHGVAVCYSGYTIFKDNTFKWLAPYTSDTKYFNLVNIKGDVDYVHNEFFTKATVKMTWYVSDDYSPLVADYTPIRLIGNNISTDGTTIQSLCIDNNRITDDALITNNIFSGSLKWGTSAARTVFKHNSFCTNPNDEADSLVSVKCNSTSTLVWENNNGIELLFNNSVISSPFLLFKYIGEKNGIKFIKNNNEVHDTLLVREAFFKKCTIYYPDAALLQNDFLGTASPIGLGIRYIYTGSTTDNYLHGMIYECQVEVVSPVGTENPNASYWYELINGEYVLSTDVTVDSEKTYYKFVWGLINDNNVNRTLSLNELQSIVTNSNDFTEFKTRIAAL